jgi:hypothetical protein
MKKLFSALKVFLIISLLSTTLFADNQDNTGSRIKKSNEIKALDRQITRNFDLLYESQRSIGYMSSPLPNIRLGIEKIKEVPYGIFLKNVKKKLTKLASLVSEDHRKPLGELIELFDKSCFIYYTERSTYKSFNLIKDPFRKIYYSLRKEFLFESGVYDEKIIRVHRSIKKGFKSFYKISLAVKSDKDSKVLCKKSDQVKKRVIALKHMLNDEYKNLFKETSAAFYKIKIEKDRYPFKKSYEKMKMIESDYDKAFEKVLAYYEK